LDNRNAHKSYWGQGGHFFFSADVDGDGRDEIIHGSCVLDDDGIELWLTGFGQPGHAYLGDIDPVRPGLEIYYGIESSKPDGNDLRNRVHAGRRRVLHGIHQCISGRHLWCKEKVRRNQSTK